MARKQAGRGGRARGGGRKRGRGTRTAARAKSQAAKKPAGSQKKKKRAAARSARPARKAPTKRVPAKKTDAKKAPAKKAAAKKAPTKIAATEPAKTAIRPKARPGGALKPPSLERTRRRLTEVEDNVPTPPSSLDMDRTPTAARSGREASKAARSQHTETGPELTGGDVDANWEDAYSVGDEAPGGDNPTPDQDRVDDIGRSLGVEYQDNEELQGGDKIAGRDKHRWELDPASAEDYNDRDED